MDLCLGLVKGQRTIALDIDMKRMITCLPTSDSNSLYPVRISATDANEGAVVKMIVRAKLRSVDLIVSFPRMAAVLRMSIHNLQVDLEIHTAS